MKWFRYSTPIYRRRRLVIENIGYTSGGVWFTLLWDGKNGQRKLIHFKSAEFKGDK